MKRISRLVHGLDAQSGFRKPILRRWSLCTAKVIKNFQSTSFDEKYIRSMKIEEARPSDREVVVAIWESAGLTRPWNDSNVDFDSALSNQQQTILVAKEGFDFAGAVMVADDGRSGWIYLLGVIPKWQRQGIGKSLMEAGEGWLARRKQYNVFLLVRNENEKVVPFYEHLGYEERPVRVFRKGLPETKTL